MEPPLRPVCEFVDTLQSDEAWPDVASWLTSSSFESKHLYTVTPGWSDVIAHLLPVLRCELKDYAMKRMKASRTEYIRSGKLLSPSADEASSRVALSVDRAGLLENANPKHCLTLVCALKDLFCAVVQRRRL